MADAGYNVRLLGPRPSANGSPVYEFLDGPERNDPYNDPQFVEIEMDCAEAAGMGQRAEPGDITESDDVVESFVECMMLNGVDVPPPVLDEDTGNLVPPRIEIPTEPDLRATTEDALLVCAEIIDADVV